MTMKQARYVGTSNGLFLQQKSVQKISPSQHRQHVEQNQQDLRERHRRQASMEWDGLSDSQYTEVFGSSQTREQSHDSLPVRSAGALSAPTSAAASGPASSTGPNPSSRLSRVVVTPTYQRVPGVSPKKGKAPVGRATPQLSISVRSEGQSSAIAADQDIDSKVEREYWLQELEDSNYVESSYAQSSDRRDDSIQYEIPASELSETIELAQTRFTVGRSPLQRQVSRVEQPAGADIVVRRKGRETQQAVERSPPRGQRQTRQPVEVIPASNENPKPARDPEAKVPRNRHTGGRRYINLKKAARVTRDGHIDAIEKEWCAPLHDGVPMDLWLREAKHPEQALGPQEWSTLVLAAAEKLALRTPKRPALAAQALRLAMRQRLDRRPNTHAWLCKEDFENASHFLGRLTGTQSTASEQQPSGSLYVDEVDEAMEEDDDTNDVEMSDETTESESGSPALEEDQILAAFASNNGVPTAPLPLDGLRADAGNPPRQVPVANMQRDRMESVLTDDLDGPFSQDSRASVASTQVESLHMTDAQAERMATKDLKLKYLKNALENRIIKDEMRRRRRKR